MAIATRGDIETRYEYLIGNTDTTADALGVSHIQATAQDILNTFPFSWNRTTENITLAAGRAEMPADWNPIWGVEDARVVNAGNNNDDLYGGVTMTDRDADSNFYYWVTYDTSAQKYYFNTKTQTGTIALTYFFQHPTLSATTIKCIIPDTECVAYGAAAKNWVADERNQSLKNDYYTEYNRRVGAMYRSDLQFGPTLKARSLVSDNPQLTGSNTNDIQIQA
jgi:hypothetical protein